MSSDFCRCKAAPKPRNLVRPLCELYAERLSKPDLVEVSRRAMQLLDLRTECGLNDAAEAWSEALLSLLSQKGWLKSLDKIDEDETSKEN